MDFYQIPLLFTFLIHVPLSPNVFQQQLHSKLVEHNNTKGVCLVGLHITPQQTEDHNIYRTQLYPFSIH